MVGSYLRLPSRSEVNVYRGENEFEFERKADECPSMTEYDAPATYPAGNYPGKTSHHDDDSPTDVQVLSKFFRLSAYFIELCTPK